MSLDELLLVNEAKQRWFLPPLFQLGHPMPFSNVHHVHQVHYLTHAGEISGQQVEDLMQRFSCPPPTSHHAQCARMMWMPAHTSTLSRCALPHCNGIVELAKRVPLSGRIITIPFAKRLDERRL